MILKFLLVVAVIGIVYFMFIKKKPITQKRKKERKKKDEVPSNEMIECEECGIYCEVDDCILSNNKYYCSDECVGKA